MEWIVGGILVVAFCGVCYYIGVDDGEEECYRAYVDEDIEKMDDEARAWKEEKERRDKPFIGTVF